MRTILNEYLRPRDDAQMHSFDATLEVDFRDREVKSPRPDSGPDTADYRAFCHFSIPVGMGGSMC